MPPTDDSPAYARNWRTVLVVDAVLGSVGAAVGVFVALAVQLVVGSLLISGGVVYVGLVVDRYRRWKALRAAAGLPL